MALYPTNEICDGALLAAFEPTTRDSDIFCSTPIKAGQTWVLALMYHLRGRGLDPSFEGKGALVQMPWLELPFDLVTTAQIYDRNARLAELAALPDPRIFKMHVSYEAIPRPPGSRSRVVTVTRDLRDLPYSMYSQLCGIGYLDPASVDFSAYFERWMEVGDAFKIVRSMWAHRAERHVLWLRYEDMKTDVRRAAGQIADFFGWSASEEDLDRVLPLVSLDRMREVEEREHTHLGRALRWRPGARFFREGAVGRNRSRLSAEQEGRIVERALRELGRECYDFVMCIGN